MMKLLLSTFFFGAALAETARQLQTGAAAFESAAAGTQAFVNSLVELMATETLSKPTFNSIPEAVAIKEVEDDKSEAVLDWFLDEQVLPAVTPVFDELNGEANCELWTFDSNEFTIDILALPPSFTIRDVIGVAAGYCLEPSNTFERESYTVLKDSAKEYNIALSVDNLITLDQRALLTSGQVFIPSVADADPATFTGNFAWTITVRGFWPMLDLDLEKQVPVSGWGPVTRTCLSGVTAGEQSATSRWVTDCVATDLIILDSGDVDICLTNTAICSAFAQAFCEAVTDTIILENYFTNSAALVTSIEEELPQCFDTR